MYNTGNPLGSSDPRDLFDNAQVIDQFLGASVHQRADRFGRLRLTWNGVLNNARLDIAQAVEEATEEAGGYRDEAKEARDDAIAAASASGEFVFAKDLDDMQSKLPQPDEKVIEVAKDSDHDNARTRYVVVGGSPVFVVNLDQLRLDLRADDGSARVTFLQAGDGAVAMPLEEKARQIVSARDFGATGEGIDEDTLGFTKAMAQTAVQTVSDGVYLVDGNHVDVSRLKGGPGAVLKFKSGTSAALGNAATEKRLDQIYWQELSPAPGSTLNLNSAPQAIGICNESVFMSQNVWSPDGSWAPTSVVRVAEFALGREADNWDVTSNAGATPAAAVVDLTGLGHGSGASVIEEGGKRWLYSSVSSIGAPVDGVGCNYGTGFTKTEWKGAGTSQADVRAFRGLKDVFSAEVCVSADGRLLVFAGYKFLAVVRETENYYQTIPWCVVFDRAEVEAAADPTLVSPLQSFKIASLTNGNLGYGVGAALAGVACDGRHIFLLHSGAQNVGQRSVLVLTISGDQVKAIPFSGMASVATPEFRVGAGGKVCLAYEIEGLAIYKDSLIACSKMNFGTPAAVVPFKGKRFIPTADSINITPSNIGVWARTDAAATVAEWSAATAYVAPSDLVYHKYLTAIVPAGIHARPHGVTGGTYIDAPAALLQGFGDAGYTTTDHFFVSYWDRQTETSWPILDGRKSGIFRLYHPDYMIANPGYDKTSYWARVMYQYDIGLTMSGGPSVAAAATLILSNARDTSVGPLRGLMYADGARSMLWGITTLTYKSFEPNVTGTLDIGKAGSRFRDGYFLNAPNVSSDEGLKTQIESIRGSEDGALQRVARRILVSGSAKRYKLKAAVAEKGGAARWHTGVIAQEIVGHFAAEGLDAHDYGLLILEQWEAQEEKRDEKTGEIVQHARDAGSAYSIRYEELTWLVLSALASEA